MTTTPDRTRRARLAAHGEFAPLPTGWVPAAFARHVQAQVDAHRDEVERIATTPGEPGRPKGARNKTG